LLGWRYFGEFSAQDPVRGTVEDQEGQVTRFEQRDESSALKYVVDRANALRI